jgi:GIY-YIG catalytic domain
VLVSCLLVSSQSYRNFHHGFSRYDNAFRLLCALPPSTDNQNNAVVEDVAASFVTVGSTVQVDSTIVTTPSASADTKVSDSVVSVDIEVVEDAATSVSKDADDVGNEVFDSYSGFENGKLRKEDLPHLPGVYVLELENKCIYIGKSNQNVDARVKEHFNSGGSAFTKKFKPLRQLEPLTQPTTDLESYERAETLEQMWVNGIKNVRGWQYTKLFLTEFEYESIFRQMCERKDLCRYCTVLYSIALCCIVWHCIVLYCVALY